jgi:hypothetical protein
MTDHAPFATFETTPSNGDVGGEPTFGEAMANGQVA